MYGTTTIEEEQSSCLAHALAQDAARQCSLRCLGRQALGPKDSPETFSVLTRFAVLVAYKDEKGRFSALDRVVDACCTPDPSSSWLALLLTVAGSNLEAIHLDDLLDVMLQHRELCPILLAGVDKVFKRTTPCAFVPLPELHPADVLRRLNEHTGTARYFKQTTDKAVYMLNKSEEMTVAQWRRKADATSYLCDVVCDSNSLELWKKSCAASLYFHLFDLHAVIREASKTRCGPYKVKEIIPPDLDATFYLFLHNSDHAGDSEHRGTVGTPLHQDGGGSLYSLHTCLVGTNVVNVYELRDCQLRLIKAAQKELRLDGSLAMDCEGSLLHEVTAYSVPRTMIIIFTSRLQS